MHPKRTRSVGCSSDVRQATALGLVMRHATPPPIASHACAPAQTCRLPHGAVPIRVSHYRCTRCATCTRRLAVTKLLSPVHARFQHRPVLAQRKIALETSALIRGGTIICILPAPCPNPWLRLLPTNTRPSASALRPASLLLPLSAASVFATSSAPISLGTRRRSASPPQRTLFERTASAPPTSFQTPPSARDSPPSLKWTILSTPP